MNDVLRSGFDEFRRWVNPVAAERAQLTSEPIRLVRVIDGCTLADAEGTAYQDFLSGYGTQALGHRNPVVEAALREFLACDSPSFFPSGISPYAGRLARLLGERTGYSSASFASSGTEAVEAALKLARAATGKPRILGLAGAYHGCTLGSLSLMQPGPFTDRFGPHLRGVELLPFGDEQALTQKLAVGDIAAVLVEPLQVEGGVRTLSPSYLETLCQRTAEQGALLIADEVQTGLGRTGRFLASAAWPRRADVVVLAKALGGGLLPLSALLTDAAIFARAYGSIETAESHQYTFAGNGLACTAGIAALSQFTDELHAHVVAAGDRFRAALKDALSDSPLFLEVRGQGLLVGIALRDADHPWLSFAGLGLPELANQPSVGLLLCHRLFRRGYLTHVCGHDWRVLRLQPPLSISDDRLDEFVRVCQRELASLANLL